MPAPSDHTGRGAALCHVLEQTRHKTGSPLTWLPRGTFIGTLFTNVGSSQTVSISLPLKASFLRLDIKGVNPCPLFLLLGPFWQGVQVKAQVYWKQSPKLKLSAAVSCRLTEAEVQPLGLWCSISTPILPQPASGGPSVAAMGKLFSRPDN